MGIRVTILGSNSAIPTAQRFPTCQLVDVNHAYYLMDCGEGAQMQLRKHRIKLQRLGCIFISHMHGDHYFGLIGLLNTLHLLGREKELHIYGPSALEGICEAMFKEADTRLRYPLHFHVVDSPGPVMEDQNVKVTSIPLKHRIPCFGYRFDEQKKQRKMLKSKIEEYNIPVEQIPRIKQGADLKLPDGSTIPNQEITEAPALAKSYAFCSDTAYDESIVPYIQGCHLLYHEATFTKEMEARAAKTFHSTAEQAAQIASSAKAGKLLLGHFSARYLNLEQHRAEAQAIFSNSELALEGETFTA